MTKLLTIAIVFLQQCSSCLTEALFVLFYCSIVYPVLLQHCMSCLTAALYVLSYSSTVCPLLQHCMFCLTAASKIPGGQNLRSHIGHTSAKVCNPCPVTMWQKYISPITGWDRNLYEDFLSYNYDFQNLGNISSFAAK